MRCLSQLLLMINEGFFLKRPQRFNNICKVYPPSINEIIDDPSFPLYRKLLTTSQEEIEDLYIEKKIEGKIPTPLEYLLSAAYREKEVEFVIKKSINFFVHDEVNFLYEQKAIVIGDLSKIVKTLKSVEDLKLIKEDNFFDFQNLIREALGDNAIEPPDPNEDPRVKRIKAKARYRDKIKAKQGLGLKLNTTLASICCMGFGLNPLNIGEISYASVPVLIRFYQEKDKYETDVKSLLAGADSKKVKPKYWIRNIED